MRNLQAASIQMNCHKSTFTFSEFIGATDGADAHLSAN